ncbi:MAG: T9SS type A sorting domain-containing protein [Aliifodinibius sp.]|nr:T9SS type A sorting domain-containing protein [Fodinibius sp.]NIV11155.1 T9SS type A sorting domain-containing protein [Fodinibius sp.]NIY24745.1 T9SS type A sorting domain-containing protein [Fodinibius sp.]
MVNEIKRPGNYQVKFNAKVFQSGVYFYRIQTGDFADTKKMILLR